LVGACRIDAIASQLADAGIIAYPRLFVAGAELTSGPIGCALAVRLRRLHQPARYPRRDGRGSHGEAPVTTPRAGAVPMCWRCCAPIDALGWALADAEEEGTLLPDTYISAYGDKRQGHAHADAPRHDAHAGRAVGFALARSAAGEPARGADFSPRWSEGGGARRRASAIAASSSTV